MPDPERLRGASNLQAAALASSAFSHGIAEDEEPAQRSLEPERDLLLLGSYVIEEAWATLDLLARAWEAGRSVDASVELLRF